MEVLVEAEGNIIGPEEVSPLKISNNQPPFSHSITACISTNT